MMFWVGLTLVIAVLLAIVIVFSGDPPDHPKDD
jgi:hypothetical protein